MGAAWENDAGGVWVLPGGTNQPVHSSSVAFGTGHLGLPAVSGTLLGGGLQQ